MLNDQFLFFSVVNLMIIFNFFSVVNLMIIFKIFSLYIINKQQSTSNKHNVGKPARNERSDGWDANAGADG